MDDANGMVTIRRGTEEGTSKAETDPPRDLPALECCDDTGGNYVPAIGGRVTAAALERMRPEQFSWERWYTQGALHAIEHAVDCKTREELQALLEHITRRQAMMDAEADRRLELGQ